MEKKFVLFKNKRAVMSVAALMILFFHLWMPFTQGNTIEQYLLRTGYIGVDMFFLVSAYSIGSRKVDHYKSFVIGRFVKLYPKFVFFALLALAVGALRSSKLLRTLLLADLFQSGGGAFLWFVPAILLMYILLPLYQTLHRRYGWIAAAVVLAAWAVIALLVTNLTNYKAIFIAYNRIPSMLLGYHLGAGMADGRKRNDCRAISAGEQLLSGALLLLIGGVLMYFYGYRHFQNVPIYNIFYVIAIPATLGLTLLTDLIPDCGFTRTVGAVTLEMYGTQMAVGYKIAEKVYAMLQNKLAANICTLTLVTLLSILLEYVFRRLYDLGKKNKPN